MTPGVFTESITVCEYCMPGIQLTLELHCQPLDCFLQMGVRPALATPLLALKYAYAWPARIDFGNSDFGPLFLPPWPTGRS